MDAARGFMEDAAGAADRARPRGAGGRPGPGADVRTVAAASVVALARAGRAVRWYVTTLMGDRAYDTYVAHLCVHHPQDAPVSERQFWRERMRDQDRNPGSRCC